MSCDPTPTHRFWLSWVQPTEDYRPLTDPPHEAIIGWWNSGYTAKGYSTLCALVDAESMAEAKKAIRVSWPEAPGVRGNWRIDDERAADWLPNDRFPLDKDWMRKRAEGRSPQEPPKAQERL